MNFTLSATKPGDVVQLRFTGDRGVPHRLGEAWARVGHDRWRSQWRSAPPRRISVEPHSEPGVIRHINLDQIHRVERDGRVIAKRIQTRTGTALVAVERAK